MSDFLKGKKCELCGKDATKAMFGRLLCDDEECYWKARNSRECAGKTMKNSEN